MKKKKATSDKFHARQQAVEAFKEARDAEMSGNLQRAYSGYKKVISLDPMIYEAHNNLGSVLVAMGRYDEAIDAHKKALGINSSCPYVHANIGQAYLRHGNLEKAADHFKRSLELKPDFEAMQKLLADTLLDLGRQDDAISIFRTLLDKEPTNLRLINELAQVYHRSKQPAGAEECYKKVIELAPNSPGGYNDLAMVYQITGNFSKAKEVLEQGLKIAPDAALLHNTFANSLQSLGQIPQAIESFKKCVSLDPRMAVPHSNMLLCMHYVPGLSKDEIFEEHKRWGQMHAPAERALKDFPNNTSPMRKLRVGYISPDIRNHSVAFFLEPIIDAHDKSQVETFCYADVRFPDDTTTRLKSKFNHYRSTLNMTDAQIASLIRGDQLDILVDLAGHAGSVHTAVLGYKPAPIQVTYLGYPDTTGIEAVDYRITDEQSDPPGAEKYYTEQLIRLPGGFHCYMPLADVTPPTPPPALSRGFVAFGSFNREFKVNPPLIAVWSRILRSVPNSHMLMKSGAGRDNDARECILREFEKNGITRDRVHLAGFIKDQKEHLATYRELDISLDTFPYQGTTTTIESIYMGVPVVTMAGYHHASRMGASLLTHVGVPEWVANNDDEYVQKAIALASDLPSLARLHATLRGRLETSPLCDNKTFTRKLEYAYRGMWLRWCRKQGVKLTPDQEKCAEFDFAPVAKAIAKERHGAESKDSSTIVAAGQPASPVENAQPAASADNAQADQPASKSVELALLADGTFRIGKRNEAFHHALAALEAFDAGDRGTPPQGFLDVWQAENFESAIVRMCVLFGLKTSFTSRAVAKTLLLRWAKVEPRNPQPFLRFGLLAALEAACNNTEIPAVAMDALKQADNIMRDNRSASAVALVNGGMKELTLPYDGMMIQVAPNIQSPTTYILLEQGDWYEEEIRLFRAIIRPGDKVLDYCCGTGLYALSAAKRVADNGKVIALETDDGLFNMVNRSAVNFKNILIGKIKADHLPTLDDIARQSGCPAFDIIKIDSPATIDLLNRDANNLLTQTSPVVFFKHANPAERLQLVNKFHSLSYDTYYYCAARQALVKLETGTEADEMVRHIVAMKPDKLDRLDCLTW